MEFGQEGHSGEFHVQVQPGGQVEEWDRKIVHEGFDYKCVLSEDVQIVQDYEYNVSEEIHENKEY